MTEEVRHEIAQRRQLGMSMRATADTLAQIEADYRALLARSPVPNPAQRAELLKDTAARIEQALASEFQYWHFGAENVGSAASA